MLDKKVIIIPDSFKGSMCSEQVCDTIRAALLSVLPGLDVIAIPIADGGEGTVNVFHSIFGGTIERAVVEGPEGQAVEAMYAILPDGTAVIEMASVAGLTQMTNGLNVYDASTYGVGQLILDAAGKGIRQFIIGLGGSSTNDGGAGAAAAMGVSFIDAGGRTFRPVGRTLKDIRAIRKDTVHPVIRDCTFSLMCDVDNPLLGADGAAAVFGPQKGADAAAVRYLDDGLRNFAAVMRADLGVDVFDLKGGGAAGGMGAGFYGLFQANLHRGIDILLDEIHFDDLLDEASLVITGEGKLDAQSYQGKVISGISKRTMEKNIPLLAIVGDVGDDVLDFHLYGITAIVSINRIAAPFERLRIRAVSDMYETVRNIFGLYVALNAGGQPAPAADSERGAGPPARPTSAG